jgi:hypothetical protein
MIAERSLEVLAEHASRAKRILYWRPIIAGVNDTDECIDRASALSRLADATVFTGLFHREQIRAHFRSAGIEDLYADVPRRKILPREVEQHVLHRYSGTPIFRKTSCGSPTPTAKPITTAISVSGRYATFARRDRSRSARQGIGRPHPTNCHRSPRWLVWPPGGLKSLRER